MIAKLLIISSSALELVLIIKLSKHNLKISIQHINQVIHSTIQCYDTFCSFILIYFQTIGTEELRRKKSEDARCI